MAFGFSLCFVALGASLLLLGIVLAGAAGCPGLVVQNVPCFFSARAENDLLQAADGRVLVVNDIGFIEFGGILWQNCGFRKGFRVHL
jgi:hypothetical protein